MRNLNTTTTKSLRKNKTFGAVCAKSGNLLVACILAGARPENVFGNEISPEMVRLCRERLAPYGVPYHNIHVGDGLDEYCLTVFGPEYEWPKKTNALF